MALYLVTGGAGFIGSNIVEELLGRGEKVRVLDNFSTGLRRNIEPFLSKIELVEGDLRDEAACMRAVQGVDYVLHQAALRAVLRSVDDPVETNEINVRGTLNLLIAAKNSGVKRFVNASSSSIYGDTDKFPSKETDKPSPESPYAASKIMGEYYCRIFTKLYGLDTVSLRYFNVFGPRQNPESKYSAVIPIFLDCLLRDKGPEVHWDGKQSRDFTYVDNVVEANLLAATAPGVAGGVFNIATHEEYSVLDVLNGLKKILKKKHIKPVFAPKRSGDVRRTYADISLSKKKLGFKTKTRFSEGLKKTVDWFISSGALK
ncbi:MAG: SDR family oxidoreductase [Candidatus Omnitrophica bacterium]|nr:SDR family oxidoreductase [Candidatus Omnitrophota bacterium]